MSAGRRGQGVTHTSRIFNLFIFNMFYPLHISPRGKAFALPHWQFYNSINWQSVGSISACQSCSKGGPLRPCVSMCVCAIIVLTAFGQFSAAFLGGQRDADDRSGGLNSLLLLLLLLHCLPRPQLQFDSVCVCLRLAPAWPGLARLSPPPPPFPTPTPRQATQNHQHKFSFSASRCQSVCRAGYRGVWGRVARPGRERGAERLHAAQFWVLKLIKPSAVFGHKIDSLWLEKLKNGCCFVLFPLPPCLCLSASSISR